MPPAPKVEPNGGTPAAATTAAEEPPPPTGLAAALPPDQTALVWIQYMRFARRTESITSARKVCVIRHNSMPCCPAIAYGHDGLPGA